ncbi:MAG: type II secretion system F family protein, partial [Gammaproteobacteria bacterium]
MATATKKMQTFTWVGRDAKGRTVRGEQDAPNPAYVKALLRRQGVQPEKVRKQPKPLFQFKS